ncbi:MAG TPA: hypothetical protein VGX76_18740, partial [Pirellulales bacterium]|nr:hypothetical protein [Pirellulales bacterium]
LGLGLTIAWCACVSVARAGCGDYVHVQGRSAENGPHAQEAPDDADDSQSWDLLHERSRPSVPPCRGPNCGRQPQVPIHGAPQVNNVGVEQWVCWSAPAIVCSSIAAALRAEAPLFISSGHRSRLERPPRSFG